MDARIKKLWIEDLRANPDTQGRGALQPEPDKFCCLGRLCNLYASENPTAKWNENINGVVYFETGTDRDPHVLPIPVREWAGLESYIGRYGKDGGECLSADNDSGHTFLQIADTIEANF